MRALVALLALASVIALSTYLGFGRSGVGAGPRQMLAPAAPAALDAAVDQADMIEDEGVDQDAAEPPDAGPPDAGPPDAEPPDEEPPDEEPPDEEPPDEEPPDEEPPENDAGVDQGLDLGSMPGFDSFPPTPDPEPLGGTWSRRTAP